MSGMSNQGCAMNDIKGAGTNSSEGLSSEGVPLNNRVGSVVIVLLRKEVGGESGLKKLIKL